MYYRNAVNFDCLHLKDYMNELAVVQTVQTMSRIELVAIINSMRADGKAKLLHKNFMVKIEAHEGIMSAKFLAYIDVAGPNGGTRESKCYNLPKRECDLMLQAESTAIQAKVYDRMVELEMIVSSKPESVDLKITGKTTMDLLREKLAVKLADSPNVMASMWVATYAESLRALGMSNRKAAIRANNIVFEQTGINFLGKPIKKPMFYLTPTELGETLGIGPVAVNKALIAAGFQERVNNKLRIVAAGEKYSEVFIVRNKAGGQSQQIKWDKSVTPFLVL